MTTRYRILDALDWESLNGQRVTIEVSTNYVILVTADGTFHKLAKAVQARPHAKPAPVELGQPDTNGGDMP